MFFVFLLWTVLGWLRLMRVVTGRSLILSILPPGFYWYLFFSGLVWGVIGLPILWGLLRGAAWMYKIFYFAALFYPLHYWFERLFLWQDPNAQKNWPFMFVLTFLWLSFAFWVRRSARVRRFFIQNQSEGP
jgi:hypothetical protein